MPISRERFVLGHSLRTNKLPSNIPMAALEKVPPGEVDLEKLGLFDASSPDFNKYYPDVTAADLNPKDEDYAFPVFRALSEIIINKYGPIDFTDGVLKPSMKKLIAQAVFTNHEQIVGNEVGVIYEVFWEKEKEQNGFKIPAGINVRLKLDGKSNPKLVRSINSEPPSIHSVSVTVAFKWVKSHPELTDDAFWNQVGTYTDKGELVRRVVTEVFSYDEISFVTHGADPYAQKINDNGELNNPAYADNRYQFSAEDFVEMGHSFDWKDYNKGRISLSNEPTTPVHNNISNNNETMTLLQLLIAKLNLAATTNETQASVAFEAFLANKGTADAEVTRLTTELATASAALTALRDKYPEGSVIVSKEDAATLTAAKENEKTANAALTAQRAEALRFYHITVGGADKADASVTAMLSTASYDTATALLKQYTTLAEKDHSLSCEDCGSKKVSRASASAGDNGLAPDATGDTGTPKVHKDLTNEDTVAHFAKAKNPVNFIHGENKK